MPFVSPLKQTSALALILHLTANITLAHRFAQYEESQVEFLLPFVSSNKGTPYLGRNSSLANVDRILEIKNSQLEVVTNE